MKTISLFYTANGSDKIYSARIEPCGGNFAVNFEFGRRGSTLQSGTKTRQPVPLAEAEKIFDAIVREKKSKGYTEDAWGNPFDGDASKLAEILPYPKKQIISRGEMSAIIAANTHNVLRKYDGELAKIKIGGATILAEFMRAPISGHFYTASDHEMLKRWSGGWYAAITVAEIDGENVLPETAHYRWGHLQARAKLFTPDIILAETVNDVEAVFASGAEGICATEWSAPWSNMLCVKQAQIYLCRVTKTGGTQSCGIERIIGGENLSVEQAREFLASNPKLQTADAGNIKMGGGKCDQISIGSFIRAEAMGITDLGKLRQPVCAREWRVA